jgi:UDP-N-acetylmuramate: L-alanyl-gamma-D-glutamyl-meso-diaminopimelate ligase
VRQIAATGRPARHVEDAEAIAAAILADLQPGDVIAVLSNGAFGGLIPRLHQELETWAATRP